MNFFYVVAVTLLSYIVFGFYIAQIDVTSSQGQIDLKPLTKFYDYRGVMNVQSERSTGTGTPESVIQEAQLAGLDFLVLTEVNDFPRPNYLDGYHGRLLVLVGGEYSFLDSRLLYLSLNKDQKFTSLGNMQLHLTDLLSRSRAELKDELLVLARPYQKERTTWSGAYPEGLDGLEVTNLQIMYERALKGSPISFLWSFFVLPFNTQIAYLRLFTPMDHEVQLWDRLNRGATKFYGYLGNNSTAKAIPMMNTNIKFPSHERSFSLASNHILLQSELTGNPQKDREKIFRALKQGQFYMSIDLLADPKGFTAYMSRGTTVYPLGSHVPMSKNLKINITLPSEPKYYFEIVIFRDGERVATSNKVQLIYNVSKPGTYRAMVRVIPTFPIPDGKKWVTWIHTNPFFVQ